MGWSIFINTLPQTGQARIIGSHCRFCLLICNKRTHLWVYFT